MQEEGWSCLDLWIVQQNDRLEKKGLKTEQKQEM